MSYLTRGKWEQDPITAGTIEEINARLQAITEAYLKDLRLATPPRTVAHVVRMFRDLRVRREPLLKGDVAYTDGQLIVISAEAYDRMKAAPSDADREAILDSVPCRYFPLTQAMRFGSEAHDRV